MNELNVKVYDKDGNIDFRNSVMWVSGEGRQSDISLSSTKTSDSINVSSVSSIKTIIVSGDVKHTITIRKGGADIVQSSEGLFILNPSSDDRSDFESITVALRGGATVGTIRVFVYGEGV